MTSPGSQSVRHHQSRLILASSSPRRRALLEQIGICPVQSPVKMEEIIPPESPPREAALDLACAKMDAFCRTSPPGEYRRSFILTADTLLACGDTPDSPRSRIIGKPRGTKDAGGILRRLRGQEHWVVTGCAILPPGESSPLSGTVQTRVQMKKFSDETLRWYLETGEGLDAAGAYKIQGRGACLIESISGSYSNVAGLPLGWIYDILVECNFNFRPSA